MEGSKRAHVLLLPYPSQGHINPMLQFAKRLDSHGLKTTLANTLYITNSTNPEPGPVSLASISDGFDQGGFADAESIKVYLDRFETVGSRTLEELIERQAGQGCPVDCLVYDGFFPWALDVAKRVGVVGACFFTQSCAVDAIYYHVNRGQLVVPFTDRTVSLPGLPLLEAGDLPSFLPVPDQYPAYLAMVLNQYQNLEKADVVLINSFYELEREETDWMSSAWPVKLIGPTVPSKYLDNRVEGDSHYGLNIYTPNTTDCMNWLDSKPLNSVIYVSFGSMAALGPDQMEELAWGLRCSNKHFLWVVRGSEKAKLPPDFEAETSERGLVVNWSPQLEVLAHRAVGCFITHCGWNSTTEGLSLGVPMVGVPQWTDQQTNAKYVADVWRVGVRARVGGKGLVGREEVERCIREVMEGERGEEIRRNAEKWRELAKLAVSEGGSSYRSIEEFIAKYCS